MNTKVWSIHRHRSINLDRNFRFKKGNQYNNLNQFGCFESENRIECSIISNSLIEIEKSALTETDRIILGVCGHVSHSDREELKSISAVYIICLFTAVGMGTHVNNALTPSTLAN